MCGSCTCSKVTGNKVTGTKGTGTKSIGDVETGYVARFCLLLVKGYRYCISPLFPPCCRFTPTCSEYALEAVSRHGAVRGMGLAVWRILRCHPFARGGYDPVK